MRRSPITSFSTGASVTSAAAPNNFWRISIAADIAALAFMKVTRDEYDPRSTGAVSVSLLLILIISNGSPRTSATDWATTVSEPWPISAAPVWTVTPPSMSTLR